MKQKNNLNLDQNLRKVSKVHPSKIFLEWRDKRRNLLLRRQSCQRWASPK